MGKDSIEWICSQYGAREFYAIPRALSEVGLSNLLITDLWLPRHNLVNKYLLKNTSRSHDKLKSEQVVAFNKEILCARFMKKNTEKIYIDQVISFFHRYLKRNASPQYFFSYSYTAEKIFHYTKSFGIRNVLGQINPGPEEALIVQQEFKKEFGSKYKPTVPDQRYWERWQIETELADYIIVNSSWSRKLLVKSGITPKKIHVIPLAFEKPFENAIQREYPKSFDFSRPLKLLYLGSMSIRKGFHILLRTMKLLEKYPVELEVVGGLNGPAELINELPKNVYLKGITSPSDIHRYYQATDVFILPTLSDGFARTLLEAQFWKLPVITTPFCGDVITNGKNGVIINEVSEIEIADTIKYIIECSDKLKDYSYNSDNLERFSLKNIGMRFKKIRYEHNKNY